MGVGRAAVNRSRTQRWVFQGKMALPLTGSPLLQRRFSAGKLYTDTFLKTGCWFRTSNLKWLNGGWGSDTLYGRLLGVGQPLAARGGTWVGDLRHLSLLFVVTLNSRGTLASHVQEFTSCCF